MMCRMLIPTRSARLMRALQDEGVGFLPDGGVHLDRPAGASGLQPAGGDRVMIGAMLDKLFDTVEASNADAEAVWIAALALGSRPCAIRMSSAESDCFEASSAT